MSLHQRDVFATFKKVHVIDSHNSTVNNNSISSILHHEKSYNDREIMLMEHEKNYNAYVHSN